VQAVTGDRSHLTIEYDGKLFQRPALCLLIEEHYGQELNRNPRAIDEIEFPANSSHADWIDIAVEEQCEIDCQRRDRETLGTDIVRHDLEDVRAKSNAWRIDPASVGYKTVKGVQPNEYVMP